MLLCLFIFHFCLQFLCEGLEDDMTQRWLTAGTAGDNSEVTRLTRSSGKMLLLHKLLAKLRGEGRQVHCSHLQPVAHL